MRREKNEAAKEISYQSITGEKTLSYLQAGTKYMTLGSRAANPLEEKKKSCSFKSPVPLIVALYNIVYQVIYLLSSYEKLQLPTITRYWVSIKETRHFKKSWLLRTLLWRRICNQGITTKKSLFQVTWDFLHTKHVLCYWAMTLLPGDGQWKVQTGCLFTLLVAACRNQFSV